MHRDTANTARKIHAALPVLKEQGKVYICTDSSAYVAQQVYKALDRYFGRDHEFKVGKSPSGVLAWHRHMGLIRRKVEWGDVTFIS